MNSENKFPLSAFLSSLPLWLWDHCVLRHCFTCNICSNTCVTISQQPREILYHFIQYHPNLVLFHQQNNIGDMTWTSQYVNLISLPFLTCTYCTMIWCVNNIDVLQLEQHIQLHNYDQSTVNQLSKY